MRCQLTHFISGEVLNDSQHYVHDDWVFDGGCSPAHEGLYYVVADLLFRLVWEVGNQLQEGLQGHYVLQVLSSQDDLAQESLELLHSPLVDRTLAEVLEHPTELVQDQSIELALLIAGEVTEDNLRKGP